MQLLDAGSGSGRSRAVSAVTAGRPTNSDGDDDRRGVAVSSKPQKLHGVVIGGGLTGLLAARVLANHVDRVTLIDRQPLPRLPELRAGVAPAVYPHVHIARGPGSLDTLLPGLTSELVTSGAALVDPARDVIWLSAGGGDAPVPASTGPVLTCSRELVEWHVRRRVSMLPCVHLLEGVEVFALSANDPRRVVTGVHVRASDREVSHLRDTIFAADFVVDATGDAASADEWLHQLGFPPPTERCDLASWSASAMFTSANRATSGAIDVCTHGDGPRALLLPIERGRMMITLSDAWPSEPPVDAASLLERARAFAHPALTAALPTADRLGPIAVRRDEWRDGSDRIAPGAWPARFVSFGVMSRWPDLGDTASTMTLGLAAQTLDRLIGARDRGDLADVFAGVAGAFQRALVRLARDNAARSCSALSRPA
jgi:2-polyprenyl-6-methoxyphenol hydroxylase-like FAD-dependent oxidoreductase